MNLLASVILFSQLTLPYETKIMLDADGKYLVFARYYRGDIFAIDSVKSLDEYLEVNRQARNLSLLFGELKKDLVQSGGYANKGIFGTFEIPLPKGGFGDFMGETGKLDVGGYVKITLGGSETFLSNVPGQERPSLLPELEMKQEMAINMDGQVGDRMRVYIDHNSERINETENKIRVTYLGREDDIIQEIEGGDTQLSIPPTNYTGDIPSHAGLFGLKSTAKFGPVDLVAVASTEQTQTQEWTFEGSIQSDTSLIWAKYYEQRRFFWIGTYDSILDLEVYVEDNNALNNNQAPTFYGQAYLDIEDDNIPNDTTNLTNYRVGYFTNKIAGFSDYYVFVPGDNIIELNASLATDYVLGVWYVKYTVNGEIDTVGRRPISAGDTIRLKMICPEVRDASSFTWQYERKNYYQITTAGSTLDSLRIYKVTSGENIDKQDNIPFIEILHLDETPKDGMIDQNIVWLPTRGLLRFPDSLPFASAALDDPDLEIYTNTYLTSTGKYYIYKRTKEAKPIYQLPENVIGVSVYVDEVLQDSIADYHVDYEQGIIEFNRTLAPTSKVRIKAEYAPFFSASQKSLVGLRGSLQPFGNAALGSSFFYRTESYPAEHTRLKEEPFNRMVWEVDFQWPQELPLVTDFVDFLPFVETDAGSKLNLNFEGAYSFSNLNARGEVWLDDLESSTIISNDVSISRTYWRLASKPAGLDTANFASQQIIWYNPESEDRLIVDSIYQDPLESNQIADVLKVIFAPEDTASFGGLTQYIYSEDFNETENLELIVKGNGGRIHVDLAQEIDEDQMRRNGDGAITGYGTEEDEDQNPMNDSWNQQNEDTGLDGKYGADSLHVAGDDANDDFKTKDYTGGINGTESNGLWDTEDIDHNGILNNENRYYGYVVDLDTTTHLVENAGLRPGWKMYRIPIKDSLIIDTIINQPDWHNMKYIRIWFDGFENPETLLIYKISVTGSRWKNYGIISDDTPSVDIPVDTTEIFTMTPVNTRTHTYYKPPYPTERDPLTGDIKSEGGLEFKLENIKNGHICVAHRATESYEDYRAYDTLTFYINSLSNLDEIQISFRLGSDSLHYYEYATNYGAGALGFNDYRLFKVSLKRFTELKRISQGDSTITDSNYKVVGNPSLAVNKFFEIRIRNPYLTPLNDTIWFNDVMLVSPKTDVGRIVMGNGSLNLADLASMTFAFNESNGRFRRLTDSKDLSTSSAGRSYAVNSNISLDKFLPETWNFSIPVGLSYNRSVQEPRYTYFANDLELSDEDRAEERSQNTSKSYTLSVSKSNSKNWLLKQTLDRLTFNHSRAYSYSQSALDCDTSQNANYSGSYYLDPKLSFKVLRQTFSLLPQNISFNALYNDIQVKSYSRNTPDSVFTASAYGSQRRKTLDPSFSVSYAPHTIVGTNYSFAQQRDSVTARGQFGEEVGRRQTFDASIAPNLKVVAPRLTYNTVYDEDHRFEIRQDEDLRNVSNNSRYGIGGSVNIKDIMKFFTKMRDETKDSSMVTGSPSWFAKQIESFVEMMQNPSFNFSRSRYSSYLNVMGRPDASYQWGLLDTIPSEDIAAGSYPGRGLSDSYMISSGFGIKVMSLTGSYNEQINRVFNYSGGETKTDNVQYPNAMLRLSRLESIPLLKKYSRSSSVSFGFNQSFEQRYELDDTTANLTLESKTISFNPLVSWQSTWVKGISSSVDINYSTTYSTAYLGLVEVPSKSLSRGGSASIAYTFSAPRGLRLPLLGGIKFASNISMNVDVNYNRSTTYSLDLENPTNDSRTLGANFGLSYNFSQSISGGANLDYTQNKEMNSSQDSKRIGLNVWTNINF